LSHSPLLAAMAWKDINLVVEPIDSPHITALLEAFRHVYANGVAILRTYRPNSMASALWQARRSIDQTVTEFVFCPSVVASVPELQIEAPPKVLPDFRLVSAFAMEGQLTHMLVTGGAYVRFAGTIDEARSICRNFMEALLGEELQFSWAAESSMPWAPWFCDIAWDATFVVYDQRNMRFSLLCMTDTD
jgi:hypothetical protein